MNDTPNMFEDMMVAEWFRPKVKTSDVYAQNLYAAMCNNDFQKLEPWALLKGDTWSCSWRRAGGIIADLRGKGDYMDWYCSGIINDESPKGYVPEGVVTMEIIDDLKTLGWSVLDINDADC